MAETFDCITDEIAEFIARQHVFFVATAPTEGGHVNVSPKGYDTFRVLGPNRVAYLDPTNLVVAVNSYGIAPNCNGNDYQFRTDSQAAQDFLAQYVG